MLEKRGFRVTYAAHYNRETELQDNENGIKDWIKMFGSSFLIGINEIEINEFVELINFLSSNNKNNKIEELKINGIILNDENEEELYLNSLNKLFKNNEKIKKLLIGYNKDGSKDYYYYFYLSTFKFSDSFENYSIEELNLLRLFNYDGLFNFLSESIYFFKKL